MIVIGASVLILVLVGLTFLLQKLLNNKRKFNKLKQRNEEEKEDFEQSDDQINTSMSTLLVIPSNRLKQQEMLGKGAFGEVYRGECKSSENSNVKIQVAIKQLPLSCANNEEKSKLEKDIIDVNNSHHIISSLNINKLRVSYNLQFLILNLEFYRSFFI